MEQPGQSSSSETSKQPSDTNSPPVKKRMRLRDDHCDNNLKEKITTKVACNRPLNENDDYIITTTNVARRAKNTTILKHFLRFDGLIPKNFDVEKLSALREHPHDVEIEALLTSHINLHQAIIKNNTDFVKDFISKNSRIKCAYNLNNECVLTTALKEKNFRIYALLRSCGYTHGLDTTHNEILTALEEVDKIALREETKNFFKTTNLYVHDLMLMSRLGIDNETQNFRKVQLLFEDLDRIKIFQPILKLVASAEKLIIVFDFNKSSICGVDFTCIDDCIRGRTYDMSNEIFIGVKRGYYDTLGTLAHEMTHFALLMTFNNNFLPYYEQDLAIEDEMNELFKTCFKVQDRNANEVISRALSYEEQLKQHAELIVRVPQLMAMYSDNRIKLENVKKTYSELFNFFENKIMPVLRNEVPFIKPRQRIQNLNKFLGIYSASQNQTYTCDENKLKFGEVNIGFHIYIQTNVPKMMLSNLVAEFNMNSTREANSDHIFVGVEKLVDQEIMDTVLELSNLLPSLRLFILEDSEVGTDRLKIHQVMEKCQANEKVKIIFVTTKSDAIKQGFFGKYFNIRFMWKHLSFDSKSRLLREKLFLQCEQNAFPLQFEANPYSKGFQKLPIEQLINVEEITLKCSHHIHSELPAAYVFRKFKKISDQSDNNFTSEENLKQTLIKDRTVIIADAAGMGKSVFVKSFLSRFNDPSRWAVFIDLKEHTEVFFQDDQEQPQELTSEWFSTTLLKLALVEQCFFEVFFVESRIVFIIDGFDEISPNFNSFVLTVLEAITKSKNMLMVTTRPHLSKKLETRLKTIPMKSVPFCENDQMSYLEKFLRKNILDKTERSEKARHFFETIQKTFTKRDFLEVPLHMTMLVEVLDVTKGEDLQFNLYQLYDKFFSEKIGIWNRKGPLVLSDNQIIQLSDLTIRKMHQKLALEYFFGPETIASLGLPELEEAITDELISRIGLLLMTQNGKVVFLHQTYAEFLVANYVFSVITAKSAVTLTKTLVRLFLIILLQEKYEGVRKFLNGGLQVTGKVFQLENFSRNFEKSLMQSENHEILYRIIIEEHTHLMRFVLKSSNLSNETRLILVQHKLSNHNEALHYSQDYLRSLKTLWSCIEDFTDVNTQKKLLVAQGSAQRNVLCQSATNEDALNFVLQKSLAIMTEKELMDCLSQRDQFRNTAIHRSALIRHFPAFKIIWIVIIEKLRDETDQRKVFFATGEYDRNVLHQMTLSNDPEGLQFVLDICKKLCTSHDELRDFITQGTSFKSTVLHMVRWSDFEVFCVIWKFVQKNFNKNDQESLMLQKNKDGSNVLIEALHSDFDKTKQCVQKEAEKILGKDGYQKALVAEYEENDIMLHKIFKFPLIDQVTNILNKLRSLDKITLKSLILSKDSLNQYILNSLSFNKVHPVAKVCWNFVIEILEPEEVKTILFAKAQSGDNAFITTVSHSNKIIVDILKWFRTTFGTEETHKVFQIRSRESRTFMHVMAKFCKACVTQEIFDFAFLALEKDQIQALLQERDSSDMTIIDYALQNNRDSSTVYTIWEILKKNLEQNDIDELRLEHERRLPANILGREIFK